MPNRPLFVLDRTKKKQVVQRQLVTRFRGGGRVDPVELRGSPITDSSKFSIKLVQSSYDYTISFLIFRSRDNDLRYFFYSFVFNKRRNIITVSKLIYLRFRVIKFRNWISRRKYVSVAIGRNVIDKKRRGKLLGAIKGTKVGHPLTRQRRPGFSPVVSVISPAEQRTIV